MKAFTFEHSPGRIDGLRIIANVGARGSVLKNEEKIPDGKSFRWLGAGSIVVRGAVSYTFPNGVTLTLQKGDVLPSLVTVGGEIFQQALEDDTLLYCFQQAETVPMWHKGYVLDYRTPLELAARPHYSRIVLVSGEAICNGVLQLNAEKAPHVVNVSAGKGLSVVGRGVLLYMFPPLDPFLEDPAQDTDPLVSEHMKGVTVGQPSVHV